MCSCECVCSVVLVLCVVCSVVLVLCVVCSVVLVLCVAPSLPRPGQYICVTVPCVLHLITDIDFQCSK